MKSITSFLLPIFLSTTSCTAQQISGTIFNDYNSNGVRNTNSPGYYEGGSPGIPIRLRDCTQDLEILTYTNELGGYLFNVIEGCYFVYLEDQYSVAPYVQPGGVEETNQIFPGNGRSYEFYVKEGESVVVNVGIVPEGFGVAAVQETTVATEASTVAAFETKTSSSAAATTTENYSQIFFAADIDDSTDVVDVPDETTTSTSSSATEPTASDYYAGDSEDIIDSESSHVMASHVNAFDAQTTTMGTVLYDAIEEPTADEVESLVYSGESETTNIALTSEIIDEAAGGTESLSNTMSSVSPIEETYISQAQVITISTTEPTEKPTQKPTMSPFSEPSASPTLRPSNKPTAEPISPPTVKPSVRPTLKPTDSPTLKPSASPISSQTAPPTSRPVEITTSDPTALSDTESIIDSTEDAQPENEITSPQENKTETNSTQILFIQSSENETAALDSALSSIAEFVVSSTENETDTNSALSSIADYVNQTKDNETTTSSSSAPSSNITDNQVSITAIKTNSTETITTDTPTAKPTTCIGCTLYLAAQVRIQLDHIENKLSENSKTLFEGVCASFLEEQLEIATPPIEDLNCTLVEEGFEVQADRSLRHQSGNRQLSTTLYHADVEVTGTALSTSSHQTPESIKFKQLCVGTFTVQGFLFVRALKEAEENATSSSSEGVFSSVENARGIMTYDASEANSGDESIDDPSNPSTGWLTTQVLAGIAAASVFCALCFMFLIVKRARRRRSRRHKYNDLDEDSDKVMPMSRNVITADIYEDFPELKRPKSDIRKPSSDDSTVPMGSPGTSPTSSDGSTSARIASIIKKQPTSPNSPGPKLITPVSIRSNNEEIEVDMIPDSFSGDQQKRGKARASSMLNSRVRRNLVAPAGKLGIMVANTSGFGPAVHTMREGSPMEGLMFVNDIIIAINGVNTRECTAAEITEMMKETADRERKITVLSSVR